MAEDGGAEYGGEVKEKAGWVAEMGCLENYEGKAIDHNFQRGMNIKDRNPVKMKTLIFFRHCFFFYCFLQLYFSFGFFSSLHHS